MLSLLLGTAVMLTAPQDTLALTLDQATARAIEVSPVIAAAEGAAFAPHGERSENFWPFPSNPTLDYGRVQRTSVSSSSTDWAFALSQNVEISMSWAYRRSSAGRRLNAAEETVEDARRRVRLDAQLAYLALAITERQASLTDSNAIFAERLAGFAERQLDAGEINRLEHNAAMLEAARARSTAERALALRGAQAANLARLLFLRSDSVPQTTPLPAIPDITVDLDRGILELARARRADLAAAQYLAEAADKSVTAAKLTFIPDLTLAFISGVEDGTDDLRGFAVGFSVPLFRRGQAATGIAKAQRVFAMAQVDATERLIEAEVLAATRRFERARRAEQRFASAVLRAATENVTLTEVAFAEGEVSVTEVVVLRTAAVAAQLEYLEVLADATSAWFELAAALNASPGELAELLTFNGDRD